MAFTHRSLRELSDDLKEARLDVSPKLVKNILEEMDLRRRPLYKVRTLPEGLETRDEQFEKVKGYRRQFERRGEPILSIDSKKQEPIGDVYRPGRLYCSEPVEVLDHDFQSYHEATMTPHGIYDLAHRHGHLNLTTGADTGEFAAESLEWYWREYGRDHWPGAKRLLLLCDCGGSNSYTSWQWKLHLKRFARATNLEVRVCHYPVYCSKYNPIERLLFSQVHLRWKAMRFVNERQAAEAAREVTTRTGLSVTAHVWERSYVAGQRATQRQIGQLEGSERELGKYNYVLR